MKTEMTCHICNQAITEHDETDIDFDQENGYTIHHMSCFPEPTPEELARELHDAAEYSIDFGEFSGGAYA